MSHSDVAADDAVCDGCEQARATAIREIVGGGAVLVAVGIAIAILGTGTHGAIVVPIGLVAGSLFVIARGIARLA